MNWRRFCSKRLSTTNVLQTDGRLKIDDTLTGAQPRFQSWGPIPLSMLLYRTKYGWYTQFRGLQSVT